MTAGNGSKTTVSMPGGNLLAIGTRAKLLMLSAALLSLVWVVLLGWGLVVLLHAVL